MYKHESNQRINQRINLPAVKSLKGSVTVEMAYILPSIILIFLLVIYTVFYYHDKNILIAAAGETAVLGAQAERQKGNESIDLGSFYRERTGSKLILLHLTGVEITKSKQQIEVQVTAGKGRMRVSVVQKAGIPKPEEKIRLKRKLEALGGKAGE